MEFRIYASNLCVRRDWYFWETAFEEYQPRLTHKFDA